MPEVIVGIWMALRHESDDVIICNGCTKPVDDKQIYNERTVGTPFILCDICVEKMVSARLELIGNGG